MSFTGSTTVAKVFAEGRAKQQGVNQSTGEALYYHGNKIAEWRKDGLYISNGGYVTYSRKGNEIPGSKTTKDKLNALPGVRIWQANCKWYLNGKEWDGSWIKVEGVPIPKIDMAGAGNLYLMGMAYKSTDGWRGYEQPIYACAGANDTGMWSDSPCRSDIAEQELKDLTSALLKEGIKTKRMVCQTSNVFCVHHYLIPQLKNVDRARQVVKSFLENNKTHLAYLVS